MNYYNEIDPFAARWLRALIEHNLIPPGEVDERSITDVQAKDLRGFNQCHFFCGIAGWPYALQLAAWPSDRPVWTGSCPCQKFSTASRGRRTAKDLWPQWYSLIEECNPELVFGEQVAAAKDWFIKACHDVETLGYIPWATVLPAVSVGKDHKRDRIYFALYTDNQSEPRMRVDAEVAVLQRAETNYYKLLREDGVPGKMAIMRCFGNAVVPQVAAEFIKAFMEITK